MIRSELVETLALNQDIPLKRAEQVVSEVFDAMSEALTAGDKIEIRGFGSFVVREYESYTGRNPKTGERIEVKPKKLPFFKTGKDLKERVLAVRTVEGEDLLPRRPASQGATMQVRHTQRVRAKPAPIITCPRPGRS